MFTQAICLTHYSEDFITRLELLGYKKSQFSGSCKNTRDDMCICTSIIQGEHDYIILHKEEALSANPRVSWVNRSAGRYITDNEGLAFALASLRDDNTDKYCFFTLDCNLDGMDSNPPQIHQRGELVFYTRDKWDVDVLEDGSKNPFSSRNVPAHKSTKEEIINYFSKDKKK